MALTTPTSNDPKVLQLAHRLAFGETGKHAILSSGVLLSQNLNLTGSGLHTDPEAASLVRELDSLCTTELFSDRICLELAAKGAYVDFVRAVMRASPRVSPLGNERKADVTDQAIRAMQNCFVVDRPARDLLGIVLAGLDDICPERIPSLTEAILVRLVLPSRKVGAVDIDSGVGGRKEGSTSGMDEEAAAGFLVSLELLPKLLSLVSRVVELPTNPSIPLRFHGLSGVEYKEIVITRLCRARWPGPCSIGICQVLRDVDLGERQLSSAVARVLRHLRGRTDLHDLPPLTYQLLLLAGKGCKEAVLEGVVRVFDHLDAQAAASSDKVTVTTHIPIHCGGSGGTGIGADNGG
ncbi:unnamed protein product, partial [Choristocarpus tenellus]